MTSSSPSAVPCLRCGDFCSDQVARLQINICAQCIQVSGWESSDRPLFPWVAVKKVLPFFIPPALVGALLGVLLVPQVFTSPDLVDYCFFSFEASMLSSIAVILIFPDIVNHGNHDWKRELLQSLGINSADSARFELAMVFPSKALRPYSFPSKVSAILIRSAKALVILGSANQTLCLPYSKIQSVKSRVTRIIPYFLIATIEYTDDAGRLRDFSIIYHDKMSVKDSREVTRQWLEHIESCINTKQSNAAVESPSA